jgi:hypothetical protein
VPDYEYRSLKLPRGTSLAHARDVAGISNEFGGWELARHALYAGGRRELRFRRRPLAGVEEPVEHPRPER